ncbi:hypothetical protein TGME49_307015 [Toxoplasma gondii ME49]|uniref:Uncharacterized protein n=4 Tax=Toxoplasma gondii TaxID=5811 RepID=A0A125YX35_TOXGV|nr:hypothetical protein TGME49_307015 [Toxoplasma gondii ME49]EPT26359.1 hypothetical protein TGME49_307015 [Toxoplasma gondii ME49]ESS28298.1 hypothetical protein TGVEG_307015 [Toxoplasma gondii VEG]KYF47312.1 hypothetical protein TGARI_307015 [Toxoplasma gondii ARI]PIL96184.1 hypothetical protein TGCOUG_307015 [Toxoplasma gondii COUG]|eukprot:XP_018635658.1 hypothetical protein TGME49_307015 [Toxoplasma gondii ME49]
MVQSSSVELSATSTANEGAHLLSIRQRCLREVVSLSRKAHKPGERVQRFDDRRRKKTYSMRIPPSLCLWPGQATLATPRRTPPTTSRDMTITVRLYRRIHHALLVCDCPV